MLLNTVYNIGTIPAPPGGSGLYEVTVASGAVSSDLSDFPLMIDLGDMPSSFWANVQDDGGDIRAYASDGVSLIPHDVTYIDTTTQRGRMFVKTNLLSASDNVVHVGLITSPATKLAATDTNGRNNVWSGFLMVQVWPEELNRVDGSSPSTDSGRTSAYVWKETAQEAYVAHQGVAYDGTHHYAVDTNYLRKYSTGLTVVASNSNPCGDMNTATGETTLNHCAAPTIIDGELWIPVEVYPAGTYNKQYIGRFSLSTLALIGYIHLTGATRESSGLIEDSVNGYIYVTDYTSGATIPYFNKATGAFVGNLTLSSTIANQQGICELDGKYYISSEGTGIVEVEKDGTVNGTILTSNYVGVEEGISTYGGEFIWTKGNTRHYTRDTEFDDWGRIHGGYLGYSVSKTAIWTMCASWQSTPSIPQQGIIGVYANAAPGTDRHSGMFDSPDSIGLWNTTNSWRYPSPLQDADVTPYVKWRSVFAQNGSSARKVLVNGGNKGETLSSSPRPLDAGAMTFEIAGAANGENGFGHYQYAWARGEYCSDAWIAADYANFNSPGTFYSVVEL